MHTQLPRLLLHSDLHLESGPFSLSGVPDGPAVLVVPGDVMSGDGGPAALRALSALPTVAIAGNHEFWGADYFERLAQLKAQAKLNDVHFLENSAVVLHGVRFLGATLWTDYSGGHATLLDYGLWNMRDHRHITAERWWTTRNTERFIKQFGEHALDTFRGKFNPLLALDLHRKTRAWLRRELARPFEGPTVIVTHHAPAFESLRRAGTSDLALQQGAWTRRMNDDLGLTKVGSYASDLLPEMAYDLARAGVRLWAHGHIHHAMHYAVQGIQVATNPRGRVFSPLTQESARSFALLGYGVSEDDIARSQAAYEENPERGDGVGYRKDLILDLTESGYQVLQPEHEDALAIIQARQAELKALRPLAKSKRQAVADLAGHRVDSIVQTALDAALRFSRSMAAQFGRPTARITDELRWVMLDCGLGDFRETAMLWHSTSSYEATLLWRETAQERSSMEREVFGWNPDRYSAAAHLRHGETQLKFLVTLLQRAPQACEALRKAFISHHEPRRSLRK